ncbi:MAG: glycosyltransferase family 4 protein [Crocinitomicaceae bacterium]
MKALYITNKPIYPKIDGGCVAMDNFLKCLLHQTIEVKHICISTNKHPFKASSYPSELKIDIEHHHIDTDVTPLRALKGLFQRGSYNINRFDSDDLRTKIIKELESNSYNCVILESLFTTTYIDTIRNHSKAKLFVRTHNLEHKITVDLATNASGIKRGYLKKLAKDLKTYELEALNKVDGILSISQDDTNQFKALGLKTSIKTIGVTINTPVIENNYTSENIFHLGSMNWQPNIEAVERLVRIFPSIRKQNSNTELRIAGSSSDNDLKNIPEEHIYYDGFVENIISFALNNGTLVSPILSGSGIRIKILELMAIGTPVITTTIGASGIDYTNGKELIVADSDEELVAACNRLLSNQELRREIGTNAIDYIRKNHNIESISNDILEFIERT